VLVYDRATVHTSKETQEELDRVFAKGNHEAQSPKPPDTNNGDASLFLNGARATACSCATNKAEVDRDDRGGVVEDDGRRYAHGH